MKIIGLTGSIATGKTTVSLMFEKLGVKVFHDDIVAKKIQQHKKFKNEIIKLFPEILENNAINTNKLRQIVLNDFTKLNLLEKIIHGAVNNKRKLFIQKNKLLNNKNIILFDTALLFEAKIDNLCDYKIVVNCSKEVQIKRIIARNSITINQFNKILERQLPIEQKLKMANFIIDTNTSVSDTELQVKTIYNKIKG